MDFVYNPEIFNCSEPISISNYFEKYVSEISSLNLGIESGDIIEKEINKKAFNLMNVDLKVKERSILAESCSIGHLSVEDEPEILDVSHYLQQHKYYDQEEIPEKADSLCTIQNLKQRIKYCDERNPSSDKYTVTLKYRSEIKLDYKTTTEVKDIKEGEEIIFHVRLYHPFRYIHGVRQYHFPRFSQELILLGSNTLADLRDKILCAADVAATVDISENPEESQDNEEELCIAKERYPSGFLYIDGTFFNDFRTPGNINYSEVVIDWAKKNPNIGPFQMGVMEKMFLRDLTVRLGYPQVYQHQGNCEHVFIFSDIRLINRKDSLNSENYPIIVTISIRNSKYCMMCGDIVARWIITHCDRLPSFPTYLCETCFRSYLYKDNQKICDFKAYKFYDKAAVM